MLRTISILWMAVSFISCGIFDVDPKYFEDKPICREIYSTFTGHIDRILAKRNETADHHPRSKRSLVDKKYNFTIIPVQGQGIRLNISSTFRVEQVHEIVVEHPSDLIPLDYSIEEVSIGSEDLTFIWISGTRCKWECDRASKTCGRLACWKNPSLCLGDIDACAKNDRDGACVKASDLQVNPGNENKFTVTNLDLGKYIYKDFKFKKTFYGVGESGFYYLEVPLGYHWNCTSQIVGDIHSVTCFNDRGSAGPSVGLLKTIAG